MPDFKNNRWYYILLILGVGYCLIEAKGTGDFGIFLSAAGDLSKQGSIYETSYVDGYHYYYSVLFVVFLKPFYYLPFYWVKFSWLFLNFFLYLRLFKLLATTHLLNSITEKQKNIFLLLTFIFSFRFLMDNIHTSQITILILACCVFGLYFIHRHQPVTGSFILALGINIKLLPLVFLPYLLFRGFYKAFGLTILFYVLMLLLPFLIIGYNYNQALLASWWNLVNPINQKHILDVEERSFHGLSTLLSTLLVKDVPDIYALSLKRNIADVSLTTLSHILLAVRSVLVLFTLYFLRGSYFSRARTEFDRYVEISYILLLIPLIFPHQQHYAFLFMVPAFAIVLLCFMKTYESIQPLEKIIITTLLILIYLSANLKLLLGEFNHYYEHYKVLTYGSLLLIPLLAWAHLKIKGNHYSFLERST